jgi:tRNA modification GTPase
MILEQDKDTISAVSTAPGTGGIAVVRISGSQALEISRKMADFVPETPESHRLYFGILKNPSNGDALDEALVAYFKKGHSFTGEEVVEVSCHGGNFLANKIVELLIANGARLARRGEFTYRAFMNGRLDLVQAEAVLSLIESRSESAARVALRQLKGALSVKLTEILDSVVWTAANLEANIDFAQEDIEAAPAAVLKAKLQAAKAAVEAILSTKDQSRLWRDGFRVSLVGRPNVGKSSLLNALLREERAIVTDIPGTTRDLVEGQIDIRGISVQMVDTAGLRDSEEVVEKIGIERARSSARQSDLILFVLDLQNLQEGLTELAGLIDEHSDKILVVRNKTDLENLFSMDEWRDKLISEAGGLELNRLRGWLENLSDDRLLAVSAKTGLGLEVILDYISRVLESHLVDDAPGTIHERHVELLQRTNEGLTRALDLIESTASPEFVAFELHTAVLALHELLGQRFDDQVMDRVFGEFCLGK